MNRNELIALTTAAATCFVAGTAAAVPVRYDYEGPGSQLFIFEEDGLDISAPSEANPTFGAAGGSQLASLNNTLMAASEFEPVDGLGAFGAGKGILTVAGSSDYVAPLEAGDLVGPASSGDYESSGFFVRASRFFDDKSGNYVWDSFTTTLPLADTRYVGARIQIDGQTHYGWVEVTLNGAAGVLPQLGAPNGGFDVAITAWGYETEAGVPVPAGAGGPCLAADLAAPFGTLDIADVVEFLRAFGAGDPAADFAAPFGEFDIADVVDFLNQFGIGCP